MRPPRLWIVYGGILQVPPRLQMVWWAALGRSRRPEVQALWEQFLRLSSQRVVRGDFLQQQAGPAPRVRLLEACVADRVVSRAQANNVLAYILDFTVVEATEDWRGVAILSQRWWTEAEAKKRAQRAVSGARDGCDLCKSPWQYLPPGRQ
jgi:hypothetical protein